ncbi:MAG TPA: hypothetical protein VGZ47_20105, partial [Gemmataceae bacterium]|nr:hypothetical protein [Gemmataceae bacterium]
PLGLVDARLLQQAANVLDVPALAHKPLLGNDLQKSHYAWTSFWGADHYGHRFGHKFGEW